MVGEDHGDDIVDRDDTTDPTQLIARECQEGDHVVAGMVDIHAMPAQDARGHQLVAEREHAMFQENGLHVGVGGEVPLEGAAATVPSTREAAR